MSIHAVSDVLQNSDARLGARLVLIALADYAEDDGGNVWASHKNIALKARMSDRQVRRTLSELEAAGRIVREGVSKHGTTIYRVVLGADKLSASDELTPDKLDPRVGQIGPEGRTNPTETVSEMSYNPSLNPSVNPSEEPIYLSSNTREIEIEKIFDLIERGHPKPITSKNSKAVKTAIEERVEAGDTAETIGAVHAAWKASGRWEPSNWAPQPQDFLLKDDYRYPPDGSSAAPIANDWAQWRAEQAGADLIIRDYPALIDLAAEIADDDDAYTVADVEPYVIRAAETLVAYGAEPTRSAVDDRVRRTMNVGVAA